jgi:parallel beta-helix repeat protein
MLVTQRSIGVFCAGLVISILAIFLLSGAVAVAQPAGRVFHVDYDGGSDERDGRSPQQAFRHAPGDPAAGGSAAGVSLQPGDTVRFKGGVRYRGTIELNWSGAEGAPIIFDGNTDGTWGDGRAIIDGSEPVAGWQRVRSAADARGNPHWEQIWVASVPDELDVFTANLTQGERLMALARDPQLNDPFFMDETSTMRRITPPAVQTEEDASESTYIDADFFTQTDPDYWRGSFFVIWAQPNRVYYRRVTGYELDRHRIRMQRLGVEQYDGDRGRFAMINVLGAISRPGDYYIDPEPDAAGSRRIYAWPHEVGTGGPEEMRVSRRATGFQVRDQAHVTIQGFVIEKLGGATSRGIHSPAGARDLVIRDNVIRFLLSHSRDAAIAVYNAERVHIEDNYIHHNRNSRGMRIQGVSEAVVTRNRLDNNGSTGITFFTCTRSQMTHNVVTNHRGIHANALTVYVDSDDVLVEGNIAYGGGHAFTVQDSANVTVRNNILHSNGAVVGIWTGYHRNLRFEHNLILGADRGASWSAGITTSPRGVEVDGLHVHNNIMAGSSGTLPGQFSHNIYTRLGENDRKDQLPEGSILVEDSTQLFVNPAEHDYRPRPGSPAIDAGRDVGVPRDIEGTSRPQGSAPDIGAYEYRQQ